MQKLLRVVEVNDDIFYDILYLHKAKVKVTNNIYAYYYGYPDKRTIYYNGHNEMICPEYILCRYSKEEYTDWRQIRLQLVFGLEDKIRDSITGTKAKAYMMKIFKDFYTDEEIDERLNMFQAEYDPSYKQYHYDFNAETGIIYKITNTYKYDINGAHLDALCEIFPKAADRLKKLYKDRKKNQVLKKFPNLFVGMLAYKTDEQRKLHQSGKYEKTYNWIVQRTTKKLFEALDTIGGNLIYANTDGAIIRRPKAKLNISDQLGDFKLEYNGDTYIYADKNYILYQFGDEMKGSCLTAVRPDIDLRKGKVVHYNIEQNSELHYRKAINIVKETINEKEIW